MIEYIINKTETETSITLPESAKYTNNLNNTKYHNSKKEQKIKTHIKSWKTIATVFLNKITIDTEEINENTVFTFNFINSNNNTNIEIPVSNNIEEFSTEIIAALNPKCFYVVDLHNANRFQTYIIDFINTVLIDLNNNITVLNELITETPTETEDNTTETTDTVQGLQSAVPHTVNGYITNTENDEIYTPVIISKTFQQQQNNRSAQYILLWKNNQDNTIISKDNSQESYDRVQFLSGLTATAEYNEETKDQTVYAQQSGSYTFIIDFPIETTDQLEHTATITITDPTEADNTCTITV